MVLTRQVFRNSKIESRLLMLAVVSGLAVLLVPWRGMAANSSSVATLFQNPPREYSTGPLWVWNDRITEQQIRETMRDLAGQKVKQVFVHPRPGLMTPYLSPEWFRLWRMALDEAERLDMNVWIYDENSYPSGFAGGWVPEVMPEARGRGLVFSESKEVPRWTTNILRVYDLGAQPCGDVTEKIRAGEVLAAGRYLTASIKRAENRPWNGDRCYVDLLYPGVTQKFLEVTHEAYRREIGKQFGKRVPGSFTDEPELRPADGLSWTDDLPEVFQKTWGYSLLENLPSLAQPIGDWKKVRHNYWQVLNELFVARWAKPYHDYCASNHLEFTGHYWDHEWPRCGQVPDNMTMYAWQQRPGIDCLMNQYHTDTHAQFGNVRAVRELSSVANQLGRKRTLCEAYGAGGWDLRFEDMKRIGDWLTVLGVNTIDQHLSYVTIRGARKRDHPQTFSYHEPWWEAYHISAQYFARLSSALTQGEQINSILVLEPTTTAWMYQGDETKLNQLGDSFYSLLTSLETAQVEYDIGCEDIIARHGSVSSSQLCIGHRRYHTVVIPPGTENLNSRTLELMRQFAEAGGTLLECGGGAPARVNGSVRAGPDSPASPNWKGISAERLPEVLSKMNSTEDFRISRAPQDKGILFHQRRQLDDGQLLFLVNTSLENASAGSIECALRGVEVWNPQTGGREPYYFDKSGQGVRANFKLSPSGSLLLFLSRKELKPKAEEVVATHILSASGPVEIRRLQPNVLTLDVIGDFGLEPSDCGFTIVPEDPLQLGKWNEQGNPFYGGAVAYAQKFNVSKAAGRFVVRLPSWQGSVARVTVNHKLVDYIGWPPWECEVSRFMRRGENTIEVAVIGTLKNTLGPHHGKPGLGAAWPSAFQTGPKVGPPAGTNYSTVGYGLFEPLELRQTGSRGEAEVAEKR